MKGGQQQQGTGQGMDGLYITVFVILVVFVIWWKLHAEVVEVIFAVKTFEVTLVEAFLDLCVDITTWLNLPSPDVSTLDAVINEMKYADYAEVPFSQVISISETVGGFIAIPIFLISILLGVSLFFYHSAARFTATYNMKKMRSLQNIIYPQYTPVLDDNIVDMGLDEGSWAMSIQPMPFCKKYKLLEEYVKDGKLMAKVLREPTASILAMQMGTLWDTRVDTQPPYIQALFAIFAAKGTGDTKSALKILAQISKSSATAELDFSGTRELLRKHISSRLVGQAAGPHAYVLTMMASMLELARTDGVISTAEFIWLKSIDRRLWYMLNTVGRRTPFPEVAGPFSHWIVEKRLRRPLKVPMVECGIDAMELAISEIVYHRDEK